LPLKTISGMVQWVGGQGKAAIISGLHF